MEENLRENVHFTISLRERLTKQEIDLVRKLQELIKEVQKYGEEQVKSHKKVSVFSF